MPLQFIADRALSIVQQVNHAARRTPQGAIVVVRWITLALLLVLALVDPVAGWAGLPAWVFVLLFAGYTLVTDLLRRHWGWYRSHSQLAALDLAVAGGLYLLGWESAGPLYTLVVLAVVSAAATLSPRGALLYIVAAAAVVTIAELTIRPSTPLNQVIVDAWGRALILGLVVVGAVILIRRLALQREVTRQARDEAERLTEMDRLRGNFVAAVSHDLQTPLTAIRAGLGLFESSAGARLHNDESKLLTNARRNVERLGLQINDLLTLNQLEADQFDIEPTPLDLRSVIASAIMIAHPLIEQKGQVLEIAADRPLLVEGDQRRLEQALVNLVANAHLYTPSGTRITVAGRETPDGIVLQVADDGPGIPAHARNHLFERYYRVDTATTGSGLGLSIVKAIVERHGGRIWVESEPGHGTKFFILLPSQTPRE